MSNFPIYSPLLNSLPLTRVATPMGYLNQRRPYPSAVERVKTSFFLNLSRDTWYWYESANTRGIIFYRSDNMVYPVLKDFKWKIISRDYQPISRLYLCASVWKKGRRLGGKIRLPFNMVGKFRPMVLVDGLEPSWAAKRILLLGRVRSLFNDDRFLNTFSL
uniref:Uncharacterized protein n=1 Tax=Leviviridae sp. TaxID=2027243 RepID=A0A514D0E1_9VIRU|nr:MAG: hypothetical protein H3BulkLitter17570_000004 [Leviviridae sp.]